MEKWYCHCTVPPVEPVSLCPSGSPALLLLSAILNLHPPSSLLRCRLQRLPPGDGAAEPFRPFEERGPTAQQGCRFVPKVTTRAAPVPPKSNCIKRAGAQLHPVSLGRCVFYKQARTITLKPSLCFSFCGFVLFSAKPVQNLSIWARRFAAWGPKHRRAHVGKKQGCVFAHGEGEEGEESWC